MPGSRIMRVVRRVIGTSPKQLVYAHLCRGMRDGFVSIDTDPGSVNRCRWRNFGLVFAVRSGVEMRKSRTCGAKMGISDIKSRQSLQRSDAP